MHIKASSAVIAPSTYFAVKACHSRKKENALSVDKVEQMLLISGCLENDDLENDDLENDDLKKKPQGGGGGLIEVCETPHPRTKPK